jgi:hypothetical protein
MKTFSFIVTVQAPDLQTAVNLHSDARSELSCADNVEVSVGQLLHFDAQNVIDELAGELTALGFGDPSADISGEDVYDVISDCFTELSLMSSEDHGTQV